MTTIHGTSAPGPVTAPDQDATACLAQVRAQRHAVIAERQRCEYLLRLVDAELDLVVAAGVPPAPSYRPVPGIPAPDLEDLLLMLATPTSLRLEQLPALRTARSRLLGYADALDAHCGELTEQLISRLAPDPSACL